MTDAAYDPSGHFATTGPNSLRDDPPWSARPLKVPALWAFAKGAQGGFRPTGDPLKDSITQALRYHIGLDDARSAGDGQRSMMLSLGLAPIAPDGGLLAPISDDNDARSHLADGPPRGGQLYKVVGSKPARDLHKSGDDTGYYQLGEEWLTGQGPRVHNFGPNDPATQILMQHKHIQDVRAKIAASPPKIGNWAPDNYSLSGIKGIPDFIGDYSAIADNGATGNLAAAFLGSYKLRHRVTNVSPDGVATVQFHVGNVSDLRSATHPPVLGYLPGWDQTVGAAINAPFQKGPFSPTGQNFDWTEQVQLNRTKASH